MYEIIGKMNISLISLYTLVHISYLRIFVCSYQVEISENRAKECRKDELHFKNGKRSSLVIDESLNELRQDDPKLINILKEKYLLPPSISPYNFSKPHVNIGGQVGQALYIEDIFVQV